MTKMFMLGFSPVSNSKRLSAVSAFIGVLLFAVLLTGCVSTGISIGPVYIPVDTGIGKNKPDRKSPPDGPPPKSTKQSDKTQSDKTSIEDTQEENEVDQQAEDPPR